MATATILSTRQNIHSFLDPEKSKAWVMCEVGVLAGDFAAYLRENFNVAELHLIDPWNGRVSSGDADGNNVKNYDGITLWKDVIARFDGDSSVQLRRGFSQNVLPTFADESLDLVYIDGDHSYQAVRRDLSLAWPKLKSGGWLLGHDYEMNPEKAKHKYDFGVKRAVDEFCALRGLSIAFKALDGCVSFGIKVDRSSRSPAPVSTPSPRRQMPVAVPAPAPRSRPPPPQQTKPVPTPSPTPPHFLCIGAIFKNETAILKEWLEHYLREGVEHFYLIDNGSTDAPDGILKPFVNRGVVTVFKDGSRNHDQDGMYTKYFLPVMDHACWFMVVDLDEFVYARLTHKTIPSYLATVADDVGGILLPWKMFGSSGHKQQPASVVQSFTMRRNYFSNQRMWNKCLLRACAVTRVTQHSPVLRSGFKVIEVAGRHTTGGFHQTVVNDIMLKESPLHHNHYIIQSWEWFQKVKMTRGDANVRSMERGRDEAYFQRYDVNEFEDLELAQKKY